MALGDVIARLSVSLSLNSAEFEKGSRKAAQEVQSLRSRAVGAAKAIGTAFVASIGVDTVSAMVEMGKAALDTVGALGEQAQQLGVTTDALQEFRFVASQTGIEQGEIDKALQRLTRTLGELRDPTKAQTEALEKLGLSAKDLQGLTADQALVKLSAAFGKLPDAAARSAVGFDLMGKSFQTLLPLLNEGPERIEAMVKAAHDLGIVLTPAEIEAADKYADQIAALNAQVDAQKAAALARYGEDLTELTRDYTQFKLDLIEGFIAIDRQGKALSESLQNFGKNSGIQGFFASTGEAASRLGDILLRMPMTITGVGQRIIKAVSDMVVSVGQWIGGKLAEIWDRAVSKVRAVGAAFEWLYDVVVGNSYVPDMIDRIAAEMARLDSVMVAQAGKATTATAKKFEDLRDLLDRLFPEVGKGNRFEADLARIEQSALSRAEKDEAAARLWREFSSGSPFGSGGMGGPDFGGLGGPLVEGIDSTIEAIETLTDKAKINTVRIAKSFKDMAEDTLQSLSRLTNAIKSGGFLDVIESVVGLGLQLASSGALGDKAAAWVNRTPSSTKGFASGTSSAPAGWAWTGERGPELVKFRGGERVYSNRDSMGMMGGVTNNYYTLPSDEFWGRVNAGHAVAAEAGAQGGFALMQHRQSRRWR